MSYPLYVAFVWHMHQPYYRAPGQMEALLPWVRLHAAKDYLHMAEVLEKYPTVHATFNMVPSLTEQLFDYAAGRLSDRVMSLAHRSTWTEQEKAYLVNICYSVNWPNIARRYPRYHELIEQRERALDLVDRILGAMIEESCPPKKPPEDWDWGGIFQGFKEHFGVELPDTTAHRNDAEALRRASDAATSTA